MIEIAQQTIPFMNLVEVKWTRLYMRKNVDRQAYFHPKYVEAILLLVCAKV